MLGELDFLLVPRHESKVYFNYLYLNIINNLFFTNTVRNTVILICEATPYPINK
jgi:hypothetical protein